jgi:hypothetical protein
MSKVLDIEASPKGDRSSCSPPASCFLVLEGFRDECEPFGARS